MITQNFESTILAGQSPNWIVFNDPQLDKVTLSFTDNAGDIILLDNFLASPDGTVKINVQDITKHYYCDWLDSFDYASVIEQNDTRLAYLKDLKFIEKFKDATPDVVYDNTYLIINASLQLNNCDTLDVKIGKRLGVEETVTAFEGYPLEVSHLVDATTVDRELAYDGTSIIRAEWIKEVVKNCNGKYLKWLNSFGGFSYWLFESYYDTMITSKSIGNIPNCYTDRCNAVASVNDLGSKAQLKCTARTSIDISKYDELKDILTTPELYLYDNDKFVKVLNVTKSKQIFKQTNKTDFFEIEFIVSDLFSQRLL